MNLAVYTTVGNRDEANEIASKAVNDGFAACAQIDEIESFYMWDGSVQNETEYRVLFKINEAAYDDLLKLIISMHSYDEPAIHAVPFEKGSISYLKWINENSRSS